MQSSTSLSGPLYKLSAQSKLISLCVQEKYAGLYLGSKLILSFDRWQGAHGSALKEYMSAYHLAPEEPLCLLCVAVAHLNQAVSRRVPDRDAAVLAAFAFFQVTQASQCISCLWTQLPAPKQLYGITIIALSKDWHAFSDLDQLQIAITLSTRSH